MLDTIGAHVGKFILSPIDATDYSTGITQIKAANPDMVFAGLYGNDLGYFMKQYKVSGINKPVLGFEYTQPAADIAGSAYNDLYLAFDYFNGEQPGQRMVGHLHRRVQEGQRWHRAGLLRGQLLRGHVHPVDPGPADPRRGRRPQGRALR